MQLKDFYFDLPEELIAQTPLLKRDDSRLMVMNRKSGEVKHRIFSDIKDYLKAGDCLVLNDTRVIPARLYGKRKSTGASIEILLLEKKSLNHWECLVRPGKKCRVGDSVVFGEGQLVGEILEILEGGNRLIEFSYLGVFEDVLYQLGKMPLPPYITKELLDQERYQTVYSKYEGSSAAPTAGLHFTLELLDELREKGVRVVFVTLHVGLGTFRPVKVQNILDHNMHVEHYHINEETAEIINKTKKNGGKIICVGTTSVRTVESAADDDGVLSGMTGSTGIFIYPGYKFKIPDAIITNFHLPESTLLMLISAFSTRENVMNAYEEAIKEKYRFFSFGDAMLLEG